MCKKITFYDALSTLEAFYFRHKMLSKFAFKIQILSKSLYIHVCTFMNYKYTKTFVNQILD
jgi:hypothetical protein